MLLALTHTGAREYYYCTVLVPYCHSILCIDPNIVVIFIVWNARLRGYSCSCENFLYSTDVHTHVPL